MSRILAGFRGYAADARAALTHAPAEVALGWLVAFSASWAIAVQDASVVEAWTRLGVAVAIALPIVFGASILRAAGAISPGTRWAVTAGALAVGGIYGAAFFEHVLSEVWRTWLLFGASAATLTLTPVLMPGDRGYGRPAGGPVHEPVGAPIHEPAGDPTGTPIPARAGESIDAAGRWSVVAAERSRFWIFFQRLVARAVTVYGLALLLAIGLSVAIASVDTLFDLNATDEETYLHVFAWILIGVGTWAMAGSAPELAAPADVNREFALAWARRLGLYLLLPLLLVYTTILYAYMARIAVLSEVPQNLVSPLVLAAGAMWLVGAIVLEPFHWLEDPPVAARILRFFPWLAVPLVLLGMWALWLRVDQYDWTEFRYVRMAALAGLLALAITGIAHRLRGRPPILKEIPITMALLLLFSATGPWGAAGTSLRSQQARLVELAAAVDTGAGSGASGRLALGRPATEEEMELADVVRYVRDHFGMEEAEAVVPAPLLVRLDSMNLLWGGRRDPAAELERVQIYAHLDRNDGVAGIPAGTLYRFNAFRERRVRGTNQGAVAFVDGITLRFEVPGGSYSVDLTELADTMAARARRPPAPDDPPVELRSTSVTLTSREGVVPLRDEAGATRGVVILENLSVDYPADGSLEGAEVANAGGIVVVSET